MLVRLTDTKGRSAWINPIHVRLLREKKEITEVFITPVSLGVSPVLRVPMRMDDVAAMLNASMPDLASFAPDDDAPQPSQFASP
ncbi:MAG: hypothetical protein H6811_04060 [Phycisphaeraceae bacterium]|nr:hypothetical protein [Phycisphaeraceae bacterium]